MDRRLDRYNRGQANVCSCRGGPADLNSFFWSGRVPKNILITGGTPGERYEPLRYLLAATIGWVPVIVLHNGNTGLAELARDCWREAAGLGRQAPLGLVDQRSPILEPLLGMNDTQIVDTLETLARSRGMSIPAEFDTVVRAYLQAVRMSGAEPCLSGLYRLCSIFGANQLREYILSLVSPRDEDMALQVWAEMGFTRDGGGREAGQLLRTVVLRLADEASRSGWRPGNGAGGINALLGRANGACFVMEVRESYGELMLPYLTQELRYSYGKPCLLVLDGLSLEGELLKMIGRGSDQFRVVVSGQDVVGLTERDRFNDLAAGMDLMVMFKQPTAQRAAELSGTIGTFERLITERTYDESRSLFDILHHEEREGVTTRLDTDAQRVRPEELMALRTYQAILFDMENDSIVRFNG